MPFSITGSGGGDGTPGPQGLSAYDVAVNNGFNGTEQEWLDSLGGGESGPKTWTAPNEASYSIHQAHGGIEVYLDQPLSHGDSVMIIGNAINASSITVSVPSQLSSYFNDVYSGAQYFRRLSMDFGPQTRNFRISYPTGNEGEWVLDTLDGPITTYNGNSYYVYLEFGGAPVLWWNANDLGLMTEGDEWKFRGAKIEYHAYSQDSGTVIGTIYIASDSGDNNVTHIETTSGANDNGNVVLWTRSGNERELYAYRVDDEDDTVRIHWTAQVYYGTEYYD